MRIYMQTPPLHDKAPRFYHLFLQQDLLDGWSLVKEWGYQGAGGRLKREFYSEREVAEQALLEARDAQIKRGYKVVFVEGLKDN
ncbi:MAG TPA: hypothetical protein ENK35_05070 [Candidatus Tenderia sp.]|nr:hypothetical protein [Candidatus Tenderia sp.]